LQEGSQLGDAVAFFLYGVPKVLLLLTGIVTLVSFLRSFVSPERVRRALAGRGVLPGTLAAAGFMLVAPFPCSLMQADVICEQASTRREPLLTGDVATLERRVCRHCIGALRRTSAA
jgi:hypothetical protein